jgi:hypothetical protein
MEKKILENVLKCMWSLEGEREFLELIQITSIIPQPSQRHQSILHKLLINLLHPSS